MPKRTATIPLVLPPRDSGAAAAGGAGAGGATRWLATAICQEILACRIRPGARLPATRDLARQYGLSRGTVVSAYEQLRAQGYLRGTVGAGTYVSPVLPEALLTVKPTTTSTPRATSPRHLSAFGRRVELYPGFPERPLRAFRAHQPALDLFPTTLWAQLAGRRLRRASTDFLLGCGPLGFPELREAVAAYLGTSRGVRCDAGQVAIVSGVQEALDLVTRLFVNPGDRVVVEDPGYLAALLDFEAHGARILGVPIDAEGMRLPPPARSRGARVAYVTPGHQFPLGISMSLRRRLELIEWARRTGALIFEDDYDGEYRYVGRPLPAMQGLDRHGVVLFAGSFGKVLFPSLRLGYLVVPPDLVDRVAAAQSIARRHVPVLEQAILADFIRDGHFGRHLRRMREIYAGRREALLDAARTHLDGLLELFGVEAGLQTAAWLREGITEQQAVAAAAARDLEVAPLGRYARGKLPRQGLQLGFAAFDEREIAHGARELAVALERARAQPRVRAYAQREASIEPRARRS